MPCMASVVARLGVAIGVGCCLAGCSPAKSPAASSRPPAGPQTSATLPAVVDASTRVVDTGATEAGRLGVDAAPPVQPHEATSSVDANAGPAIVDWPITWPVQRDALMLQYRRTHNDPAAQDLTIVPKLIVLHYTAGGSAKATKGYFDNLTIEPSRKQLYAAGKVNVSAHFLVDLDGTIYRLMPATKMARHCIGLNHNAIGIENVGDDAKIKLTDAQVAANIALVRYLAAKYPTITHLLGHFEVMGFTKDPMFVELDPTFRNDKPDPGPRFLALVRAGLRDLPLRGLPAVANSVSP